MFRIYLLLLYFAISISLARLKDPDSAEEEEASKILAKWLGVEIGGAYCFDWPEENGHLIAPAKEEQQEQLAEQMAIFGPFPDEMYSKRFVSDPPDDCFPMRRESSRSTEEFMRLFQQKFWDDLRPVSCQCSAHSSAERSNTPTNYYLFLAHEAAFLIVAQLLYEM